MDYPDFDQVFDWFNDIKVLIIGDVMLDVYMWGSVERISPEAPVPIVKATKREYRLGGAGNVAINVKGLGATPVLCAVVGRDEEGIKVCEKLTNYGMTNEGIVESMERSTTVKRRVISGHQHVVRIDEETDKTLDKLENKALMKRIEELLPLCDVVVFEDYDKGVISRSLIAKTLELAKKNNTPTIVDPKNRNFNHYKNITLFKPNLKELREGLKVNITKGNVEKIKKAVSKLRSKLNCNGTLITLSENGVYIDMNEEKHHIPAHVREIADVSGAGDTVTSIAALCLALKLPPKTIAMLSNLGGGLVCEHVGVVSIDKEKLLREAKKINIGESQ